MTPRAHGYDVEPAISPATWPAPPQRLVELVVNQIDSDWRLRERLAAEPSAVRDARAELRSWRIGRPLHSGLGTYCLPLYGPSAEPRRGSDAEDLG